MATAIPGAINPRRLVRDFQLTNRLRREGTRNLLEAAHRIRTPRFISQSVAYAYHPAAGLADETAPLWRQPPKHFAPVLDAFVDLEQRTIDAGGLVLRLGHLHGPGTAYAPTGPSPPKSKPAGSRSSVLDNPSSPSLTPTMPPPPYSPP
jgi:hypothetical protein